VLGSAINTVGSIYQEIPTRCHVTVLNIKFTVGSISIVGKISTISEISGVSN
jgi:hypothetical protein